MSTEAGVLLAADEPGPYELIRPMGKCPLVIVCDHASNRIPRRLLDLGLSAQQLDSHIAWDAGAAALARELSARLDAPLVLSNYSRLVIDCNRPPGHVESIARVSDSVIIPGNDGVSPREAKRRQQTIFNPYQQAIAGVLSRLNGDEARLLSIHSFTPELAGSVRPWSIGVCYDQSEDWAKKMLTGLRTRTNSESDEIGDNQPYDVDPSVDYTVPVHGKRYNVPGLMLELRQDKIADESMIERWSNIIAGCCEFSG